MKFHLSKLRVTGEHSAVLRKGLWFTHGEKGFLDFEVLRGYMAAWAFGFSQRSHYKKQSQIYKLWTLAFFQASLMAQQKTGYPLQYSGLENSIDCIVPGIAKSQRWLRGFHFYFTFSPFSPYFPAPTSLPGGWPGRWRTLLFHGLIAYILDNKINVETVSTVLAIAKYMRAGSCLTLLDPLEGSQLASSVHGILPARILEWVAISAFRWFSWPRDWTCVPGISCISRKKYYTPIKILF